jgi:myo-inositol-1(or 4)-monophosphatase
MNSGNPAGSEPSARELLGLAESAARVGGELARESFGQPQQVTLKADRSEVTAVDLAVERAIVAHIRARRSGDVFIGEEAVTPSPTVNRQSPIRNRQSVCWVIDPIDGTRNFIRDMPLFTCSVAAMQEGQPVAGAIYEPIQGVLYSAARGCGAQVNGRRVHLEEARRQGAEGPSAKLFVGIPSARRPATRRFALHAMERHIVRNFGSVALHLALTALGHLDVSVVGNAKLWDIAAGCLLVSEAGGVVTTPDGAPIFPLDVSSYGGEEIPVVAGNPAAHARMMEEVGVN